MKPAFSNKKKWINARVQKVYEIKLSTIFRKFRFIVVYKNVLIMTTPT